MVAQSGRPQVTRSTYQFMKTIKGVEVADVVRASVLVVWVAAAWVRTPGSNPANSTNENGHWDDPPTEGGPMIQNRM